MKIWFHLLSYRGTGEGGAETAPVSNSQSTSGAKARGWDRGESQKERWDLAELADAWEDGKGVSR